MVVTRRQSVSPPIPPAASRTNSSPGLSRLTKGKDLDKSSPLKSSSINSSSTPQNGTLLERPQVGPRNLEDITFDDGPGPLKPTPAKSSAKSRSKQKPKKFKSKKQHSNKGIRGFDIVARVFLVWLTVYTLSVCPDDTQLRSPVCRALTQYRRTILEPYIIPPIRATIEHPAIMPHIQRVQPYYYRTIEASKPMVWFVKREWQNRVVPQMGWLQLRARPYVLRLREQYNLAVGPYVELASDGALRFRHKVDPYVLAATIKSRRGWETAWPYLMPIWREAERLPGSAAEYIGRPLGEARRQWVDPHVAKIWDTIMEKSGAGTRIVMPTTKSETFTSANPSLTSSVLGAGETTPAVPTENVSQTTSTPLVSPPNPNPTDEATTPASSTIVDTTPIISSPSTHSTTAPSGVVDELVAASVDEESSITTSTTVHGTPESVDTRSEEDPEDADGKSSRFAMDEKEVQPPSEGITDPISDYDEDTEDLDAFLAELETGSDFEPAEPPPPPPPPPAQEHEETQEELEERIRRVDAQYAHVRAEIEARHTKWEMELERVGKAQRKVVRTILKSLRDAASQEARADDGPIRTPIETLNREAERSLRSVKSFARKLAAEDKSRDEKARSLELIVQKVDKKFSEHVDSAAQAIRAWLNVQNDLESREIANIAAQVSSVADRAQDDLGMDYTWLPGVTLDDWKRYHKLKDTSRGFHEWYTGMQNGSVPNAPPNPVVDIMEAIQEEVDDMILGFDSTLGRIKAEAISSYGHVSVGSAARNTPGEETSDRAPVSESVPKVSMLRVNPDNAKDEKAIPPVILSRGKEEIMSAASRAEETERRTAGHAEL